MDFMDHYVSKDRSLNRQTNSKYSFSVLKAVI